MNTEDRAAYLVSHLDASIRQECSEIDHLETSLSEMLADVQALVGTHISDTDRPEWALRWSALQSTARSIRNATSDARQFLRGTAAGVESGAVPITPPVAHPDRSESWMSLREMGVRALPPGEQEHWQDMWRLIEAKIAAIRGHADSLALQLELHQKYSGQRPSHMAKDIVSHASPAAKMVDVEKYGEEYREAVQEVRRERQQPSYNFNDILKSMFMYIEGPEEKVQKKHQKVLVDPKGASAD